MSRLASERHQPCSQSGSWQIYDILRDDIPGVKMPESFAKLCRAGGTVRHAEVYAFTNGWPGDVRASLANFASSGDRSDSPFAAAIRLRSLVIFSLRTRRRRISGLRLGADMNITPWFQDAIRAKGVILIGN